MLLRKYDIYYILNLEFLEGIAFIEKALEKDLESILWDRWLVDYRNMTKDNFISFKEYKDNLISPKIVEYKTKEEMLAMADEIESKSKLKRGDINGNGDI